LTVSVHIHTLRNEKPVPIDSTLLGYYPPMKRAMFIIAGACWFLFALGFAIVLLQYIGQGAGLQFFGGMFSSGSVLLGLVHVVGFLITAFLCFAIGAVLLTRGFVPAGEEVEKKELEKS
jgi:hypothetical protein